MQPGARCRETRVSRAEGGAGAAVGAAVVAPGSAGARRRRPNGTEAGAGGVAYAERAVSYHHDVGGT